VAILASACAESPTSPSSLSTSRNGVAVQQGGAVAGFSLRFYGNGGGDVDRLTMALDPQVPADVGHDFTIEFWMKADTSANGTTSCQAGEDGWRYGNVIVDRSMSGSPEQGEYGISVSGGRIAFGVANARGSQTLCGLIDVADGRWHHVAVTRRAADGQMRVYVNGNESAQGVGPTGDISYRDGRAPGEHGQDALLVLGAGKEDAKGRTPGFAGWIDEFRMSSRVRYLAPFDRPGAPFMSDADTVALYHFDEGPQGPCASAVLDASGRGAAGQCRHGGATLPGPAYVPEGPFIRQEPRTVSKSWLNE